MRQLASGILLENSTAVHDVVMFVLIFQNLIVVAYLIG